MREIELKFGFPFFTKQNSTVYLIKSSNVYVSDIWSFWDYLIRKCSVNSGNLAFLQSLLEQAKYFFEAAENAPFKSKPLLYYYSFLNLAKIVVNLEQFVGTGKKYNHGVECKWNDVNKLNNAKIEIKQFLTSPDTLSVSYQLMKAMGNLVDSHAGWPWQCNVFDLFESCVGIHRTVAFVNNQKESFFRLDEMTLTQQGKKLIFKALIHDCSEDVLPILQVRYGSQVTAELDPEGKPTGNFIWTECVNTKSSRPSQKELFDLAELLRNKGIWYFWDGTEAIGYISAKAILMHSEEIIYHLMFFLGSITRYQPYKFDELLSEKERWMVGEFLESQPKQFLYLVTSKIIGTGVLRSRTTVS